MQELGLLFLILAALSAPASRSEAGCRAIGRHAHERTDCADVHDLGAQALAAAPTTPMAPAKSPASPRSLPADALASAPKPVGPAKLEIVPGDSRD